MRYLILCDKFKGSLSARQVGEALAWGVRQADPRAQIQILTGADGGEGLLDALAQVRPLRFDNVPCRDPLGRWRSGRLGYDPARREAVIESCEATGLQWLSAAERDPWRASSAGLGDLLRAALALQPRRIYIGLGSSATCDGGLGCLSTLGWRLLNAQGQPLAGEPASLAQGVRLEAPDALWPPLFLLSDVLNPALGPRGAMPVFAPQKGADAATVTRLEAGLAHWVRLLETTTGRALADWPGGGAAGGLGLSLHALLGAERLSGAAWVLEQLEWSARLAQTDVLITGEGAFDASSAEGKLTGTLLQESAAWRAAGGQLWLVSGQRVAMPLPGLQVRELEELAPGCRDDVALSQHTLQGIGVEIGRGFPV
ncbi:MAG: glycerate kinase [Candidatus Sericytochromatia bacterium]